MFEMLYEANFTYDSSMPVFENKPPFYPYTLDYAINHECMITPCPTKSYPGVWEIGMIMWEDHRGGKQVFYSSSFCLSYTISTISTTHLSNLIAMIQMLTASCYLNFLIFRPLFDGRRLFKSIDGGRSH